MCRHLLLSIVFISGAFVSPAQSTTDYTVRCKAFTDSVFSYIYQQNEPFLLAEEMDASTFAYLKRILSADTFYKRITYDRGKTIVTDTFVLTRDERKLIDSFYSDRSNFNWTTEYINHATILPADTLKSISNYRGELGVYLSTRYGSRRLFTLSKPIFLRSGTICIFFNSMACGMLCGGGTLTIYRKENGKWNRYRVLAEWVS